MQPNAMDPNAPDDQAEAAPDDQASDAGGDTQAPPEEQAQYEKVMTVALAHLYGNDTSHKAIVDQLKASAGDGKLADGIGLLVANILKSCVTSASEQGTQITDDVLLQAGAAIVAEMIELAQAMHLVEQGKASEQLFQDASIATARTYGQGLEKSGAVTPQVKAQAQQFMQQQVAREQTEGKGAKPKPGGLVRSAMGAQP